MDFIVARFNDTYGYISTGKDKSYGFNYDRQKLLEKLGEKDKNFTYATPEELALSEHQREWTHRDSIHYNKLKFYYDRYDYQMTQVLIFKNGVER